MVDWFCVVDLWPENRLFGIVWMVRLEKLGLDRMGYWAKRGEEPQP